METVAALFDADLQPLGEGALVIDLAHVEVADSAAVSLLLSWLRRAQRIRVVLSLVNVPDNLLSLAKLYGVAELLPCSREPVVPA
jgi:phospholipid transport system transporter-binding protein